jgi:exosome complex exonuclease RRP6
MINHVLARFSETCLRIYTTEVYDRSSGTRSDGWETLVKKWNKPLCTASSSHFSSGESNQSVSKEEHESTRYVLQNQHLLRIAETPPGDLGILLRLFGNSAAVERRAKEKDGDVNKNEEKVEQIGKLKGVKLEQFW